MLEWYRCKGEVWCDLFKVDLNHSSIRNTNGVYVIWYGSGANRKVLRVGQGNIYSEILKLQNEIIFKAFAAHGVMVSWVEVPPLKRAGVLIYLINTLNPAILGDAAPRAIPIKENLPWDEM
jgi:hypothetical protein